MVCFDISDDKAREKVGKTLKGFGYRVQKSMFECPNLNRRKLEKLKKKLEEFIDPETDSIRFYQLCKECVSVFKSSGNAELPRVRNFLII